MRHSDEIRIGHTRLVFRDPLTAAGAATEVEEAPPALTARERDVLVALCRPLLARDMFTEPASTRTIADELVITRPPSSSIVLTGLRLVMQVSRRAAAARDRP